MDEWKQRVLEIVEHLKDYRSDPADGARVLEAIICHCSELAREGPHGRVRDIAVELRSAGITMYARSKSNASEIAGLLEKAIHDLEMLASGSPAK